MQYTIHILLLQYVIFGNNLRHLNAKGMIGFDIRPAITGEFPAVVCILKQDPSATWENNLLCTGTLITGKHVLTAEHCFFNEEARTKIEVTIGGHNYDNGLRHHPVWWITFHQWTVGQGQELRYGYHDILIVRIFGRPRNAEPCVAGYVYPIEVLTGEYLKIVGCNKISTDAGHTLLAVAPVKILDRLDCQTKISRDYGYSITIDEQYICSFNTPYTLIEKGDSGGPLLRHGVIIAMNMARCPTMDTPVHPSQVNIHLNLYFYQNFINAIIRYTYE